MFNILNAKRIKLVNLDNNSSFDCEADFNWNYPHVVRKEWFDKNLLYQPDILARKYSNLVVNVTKTFGSKLLGDSSVPRLINEWFTLNSINDNDANQIYTRSCVHWPITNNIYSDLGLRNLPSQCQCLFDIFRKEWFPRWDWIIIAPQRSFVAVHRDMYNTPSWNILTYGKKLWAFWSPERLEEPVKYTSVKTFEEALSMKDLTEPDYLFIQEVNDFVSIPSGWWHSVYYLEPCICVSKNLVTLDNIDCIIKMSEKSDPMLHKLLVLLVNYCKSNVSYK
jgi:hypothetical protein